VKERVAEGYSIVIFPEGTRSRDGQLARFHKGAFYLAQELGLDIQPLLIFGANEVNAKNDIMMRKGTLLTSVMERVSADDPMFEQRMGLVAKDFQKRMKVEQRRISDKYMNSKWLHSRLMHNYYFKGGILEWYVRIKLKFERKNFEKYDQIIGDRQRIYDIGCGYGYLSFYLHYRNPDRIIYGCDYDDEKVNLAANCVDKSENLTFEPADARTLELEPADVIIYTDVLHYLTEEEQQKALKDAARALLPGGKLLIRDGITDLEGRHGVTERTERYSTGLMNFNKAENELSFFSSEMIQNFAAEHGLTYELVDHEANTSNVLMVLTK